MHRAVIQDGYNAEDPFSTLKLISKPIPTAAPGHVVVHITLRPVNPTDEISVKTGRVAKQHTGPVTIGSEGVGIVESVSQISRVALMNYFPSLRIIQKLLERIWQTEAFTS
jgi:NADPH:quinone reductase-like Zn-dependent oxidoreductase